MTNIAKFDVDADGGDYGFQLTPSTVHALKLRMNPPLGIQRVMFQVYSAAGFNPALGIAANPPRASDGAPVVVLDNGAGSTGQAVTAATPTAEVDFPAPSGVHSWIVRCVVNGGMRAGPNGVPVPDPNLIYERMLYLPGYVEGTRKIVATESTQGDLEGWSKPINALIGNGGSKKLNLLASELTAETVDFTLARQITLTLDQDITLLTVVPPAVSAGHGAHVTFQIKQDGTGGWEIGAFSANVLFPGGTDPALSAAAGSVDVLAGYVDGDDEVMRFVASTGFVG